MLRIFRHYVPGRALVLMAGDAAVILGAAVLATRHLGWPDPAGLWVKTLVLSGVLLLLFYIADLYNVHVRPGKRELVLRVTLALGVGTIVFAALAYSLPSLRFARSAFFGIVPLATVGLVTCRLLVNGLGAADRLRQRVLVVGTRMADQLVAHEAENDIVPFRIVGFVDDDPAAHDNIPPGYDLLGKSQDLLTIVNDVRPSAVVVALPDMRGTLPVEQILECRFRGIRVQDWSSFYEQLTSKVYINSLRPSWLIFSDGFVKTRTTETLKRGLDVVLALGGLVLTAPLAALIAVCIKLDTRGPVLFRQDRMGKDGRVFLLNKFRSMRVDAEAGTGPVWATADDPRVTRVGRILRKARLDELPQMLNVLKGDMSFVGPRPERPEFIDSLQRQIPFYRQRLSVKPGITGWAQVRHGYAGSVEDTLEKLQYDLYYIKNMSPFLDLLILVASIQVVLFGRGAR